MNVVLLRQRDWCEGGSTRERGPALARGAGCTVVAVCGAFDRRGSLRDFLRPEPARSLRSRPDTGEGVPLLVEARIEIRQLRQSAGVLVLVHVAALGMTSSFPGLFLWQSWNRDPEIELRCVPRDGLFLSQTLIY